MISPPTRCGSWVRESKWIDAREGGEGIYCEARADVPAGAALLQLREFEVIYQNRQASPAATEGAELKPLRDHRHFLLFNFYSTLY